jgi:hypothetical protein
MLEWRDEIFMPAIKEIHYFSQIYNSDGDVRNYGPAHRIHQAKDVKDYLASKPSLGCKDKSTLAQIEHLVSAEVDDEWYAQVFAPARDDQVCIEVCPSYMNMPEAAVQHVLRLNPTVHLLAIVRDPVERCWSHIRMHIMQGLLGHDLSGIVNGGVDLWPYLFYTDYAGALGRWRSYSAPGQLKLILYDQVLAEPNAVLEDVYSFAGLPKPRPTPERALRREVFKGGDLKLPPDVRKKLLEELEPQYEYLRSCFPDTVDSWLLKHSAIINMHDN